MIALRADDLLFYSMTRKVHITCNDCCTPAETPDQTTPKKTPRRVATTLLPVKHDPPPDIKAAVPAADVPVPLAQSTPKRQRGRPKKDVKGMPKKCKCTLQCLNLLTMQTFT